MDIPAPPGRIPWICRRRLPAAALLALALAAARPPEKTVARPEPIGRGARFEARSACSCSGVRKKGIFAHPPWKGRVKGRVIGTFSNVDLSTARRPEFRFFMGIQDGHGSTKGVIYRVFVNSREVWQDFYARGVWKPVRVSLAKFAGRTVAIELAVDTLGEHYANWGEPRIVDGSRTLYDFVAHVPDARKTILLWKNTPPGPLPASLRREREIRRKTAMNVVPAPRQIAWQELEFIAFAHFGVNTFTDREWGEGTEDPRLFKPSEFDADQWARVLEDAGIRLLILTAKHHDGFCLWPSRYTEHCVRNSPWRNGKGDVVREVSEACRRHGIKFGVYLSPWDRNNPDYGNSPAYNRYFVNQLRELLGNYGEISEVWFDGACGEGPNGRKQVYDWAAYHKVVRELQPNAVIAICGPDVRWVGNESGVARETEWSVQPANPTFHGKGKDLVWWPAECDVSIRPGWFYHAAQDDKVKSLEQLLDIYYKSVGRNSVLLLNIPPDRRGLFHENDAARLRELRNLLDRTFRTDLAAGARASANSAAARHGAGAVVDGDNGTWWEPADGDLPAVIELDLGEPRTFNCVLLQEYIPKGQRVEGFSVQVADAGGRREIAAGSTIGYKRLLPLKPAVTTSRVRIEIRQSRGAPLLRRVGLFNAPLLP